MFIYSEPLITSQLLTYLLKQITLLTDRREQTWCVCAASRDRVNHVTGVASSPYPDVYINLQLATHAPLGSGVVVAEILWGQHRRGGSMHIHRAWLGRGGRGMFQTMKLHQYADDLLSNVFSMLWSVVFFFILNVLWLPIYGEWSCIYSVRQKKGNSFLLWVNLFNMQCNLKKFSTLIVNEYYHRRCYLFNFWNLHLFER